MKIQKWETLDQDVAIGKRVCVKEQAWDENGFKMLDRERYIYPLNYNLEEIKKEAIRQELMFEKNIKDKDAYKNKDVFYIEKGKTLKSISVSIEKYYRNLGE